MALPGLRGLMYNKIRTSMEAGMDLYLDRLLNLPNTTVESLTEEENKIIIKLRFLHDENICPYCQTQSGKLKQNRPILIRDLSVFAKVVYLDTPPRQFYCHHCQKHLGAALLARSIISSQNHRCMS
jgi:transposase